MASKLTLNMGDAAYAASLADGVTKNGRKQTSSDKVSLRRGKWTPEEEHFALRLIEEFKAGLLPLTDGTTLRTFLSKLLNCDPMRISKKFVGDNCIGKQVFRHATAGEMGGFISVERMDKSKRELAELERKFLDRLLSSSTSSPTNSSRNSTDFPSDRKSKKAKVSPKTETSLLNKVAPSSGRSEDMLFQQGVAPPQLIISQPQQPFPGSVHPEHQYLGGAAGVGGGSLFPQYSGHDTSSSTPLLLGGGLQQPHTLPQAGFNYPPMRPNPTQDVSGSSGYEDWRQQQQQQMKQQGGSYDAQLNWQQQYLPSQQFFDQHQSQLRSMGGGGGVDQSEEGLLKAKGSFYKSIKSSSTSSLDLLGTLATSISRENLVSYGNSGDSSCSFNALNSGEGPSGALGSMGGSRQDPSATLGSGSSANHLKRNSKSIQDFWMLVEMGDLSRPDQEDMEMPSSEDVDSAVFDMGGEREGQEEKANQGVGARRSLDAAHCIMRSTSADSRVPANNVADSTACTVSGAGEGTVGGSAESSGVSSGVTVMKVPPSVLSRCESAPAISSLSSLVSSTSSSSTSDDPGNANGATTVTGHDHDPVILQSLLSMASGQHLRQQAPSTSTHSTTTEDTGQHEASNVDM